ncbi:MAG: hypothetical protein KAS66_16040, partial [Candidatus Omnitrophica bacterium]|nr:hypothetical protein [Candidatus Omnitrophota bacterium]
DDFDKCSKTRAIIDVDWPCELIKHYSDDNIGCKVNISSGLDWAFSIVDEAIILEDDCLPHPTFFRFCDEMLEHYRDDNRIAMISGDNFQFGKKRTNYSYYFSRYPHIWGWATWKRSWDNYDVDMKMWPEVRDGRWLEDILQSKASVWYWRYIFNSVFNGKTDSWGYPWTFSCWKQGEVSVLPNNNLISNIGSGADALHTKDKDEYSGIDTSPAQFPISHPPHVVPDHVADAITEKEMFSGSAPKRLVKKLLNELIYTRAHKYWVNAFNFTYFKEIDAWDYQWVFKCFIRNERSVVPNVNLVSNIGFGADALHTVEKNKHIDLKTETMVFPIFHPPYVICDSKADTVETKRLFSDNSIVTKLLRRLK